MLSMERPSTSHGEPNRSGAGPFGDDFDEQRPHTAQGNTRDSLSTEIADGSFRGADRTGYEASEYRRRLDEFRQMSAPDLAGSAFGEMGPSGRLSQTDFLRFSRPSKLTGIRDKLKLETMSRAYGVSYSQPRRRQLSPVKKRAANGTTPGQPFIEDPIEVTNCDEVILSWKAPMNAGGGILTAFRIKYSASHIKGVKRNTPPADDMVIVQTIADPEARRASIRGLLPGTTYSFRMVCQNTFGWGKPGRALYATTLSHPVPRFVAGDSKRNAIELAWSVPGGFIDVTEVQIEFWQHSQSNIDEQEEEDADRLSSELDATRPLTAPGGSRGGESMSARPSTAGPPLEQRTGTSRCITIDAQRHDHCTLKDLMPGTVYAIRGRTIRRAPSHYDERDPRYGALLEAGLVDLGRASHTCPWSRPIKTRTVPDVPAVPKVKVVRPGSVSVTLEWREPRDNGDPITSYDVQVCDAMQEQDDMWVAKSIAGTRLYTSFSDLPSFTAHRVRVRAINAIGPSEFSSAFAFQTLPSESVPDLVLIRDDPEAATMRSTTVRWDRPLEVAGCPLDGYEMEYQVSRLQSGAMIDTQEWVQLTHPPRATSFTLEDLNPGNMVQFRMRALNVNGTGPWSDVVESKTEADVPAVPFIAASKVGSTNVTVYWKTPLENGSDITSYQLEYSLASDPDKWLKIEDAEPGAKKAPTGKGRKVSALSKLRSTAKDIGAASDAGAALEAENMHAMDGLFSFDTHTVRVRALNSKGFSEWSAVHTFTTDPSDNIPGTMHLDGGDLCADGVSRATEENLTFIWQPPTEIAGVILQRYQLEYRMKPRIEDEEPGKWSLKVLKYSDMEWTLEPLEAGQWVEARIRAKNANGFGHWSAPALVQSVPIPPDAPADASCETKALPTSQSGTPEEPREPTHECLVAWMPSWNNGHEIGEFEVHVTLTSGEQRSDGPYTPYQIAGPLGKYGRAKGDHTIENLLPFEEHEVRLRAKNRKGWGAWSEPFAFKTKPSLARPPKMVLNVAKALGPAKGDAGGDISTEGVVVRWKRPVEVPGVDVLGFVVEHRETGGVEMEPVQNGEWIQTEVGPDVYFCKINLLPGMGVEVRVAARNVNGVGNMSDEIVSAALPKPPEPPVEPTYLEVEDCSVLCRWTKPESIRMSERGNCLGGKGVNGAVILEYEVEPMPLVDASEAKPVPSAKLIHPLYTHARMGQLEPFTEYCLTVRARNVAGWSEAAVVNIKTGPSSELPAHCNVIGNPETDCDDPYSISVGWEPPKPLPGVAVDSFELRYRKHDAVGTAGHRTVLGELKDVARGAASEIFTALSGGDLIAILEKLVSFDSNEMCRETEKAFGREHSEGLMAAVSRRCTGGIRALFKQLMNANRDINTAPSEALAEKQIVIVREALTFKAGESVSDYDNVCQQLVVNSKAQQVTFCKAFVKQYGFSPHEVFVTAGDSSSDASDKDFAAAVIKCFLPDEKRVVPPCLATVQQLERIIMGGAPHELSLLATATTLEITEMVALYRRRFGSSLIDRINKKTADDPAGLQKVMTMLTDRIRLEDCPVVDDAVNDDLSFLKDIVDTNRGGEDGDHRRRLLEMATVRPHSHLKALQDAYGPGLATALGEDDFCMALGACLAAVPKPKEEIPVEEPPEASADGWEVETLTKTTWKLEKLKPGTPADLMLRAHNANGYGEWTGPQIARSKAKEPDVPEITTAEASHDTVTLSWQSVPCNGSLVDHFDIDVDGIMTEQVAITVPELPNQPTAIVSGLRPNKDYAIRVRAYNSIGNSAWSSAEAVRTTLSPAVLDIQSSCFPEKGGSKDPFKVFKTLWELTNEQIMVTREVYQEKFGQDLKEVLNKFTSGPFQLLTLMVVDKLRVEFGQLSVRIDGGYKLYKTQTPTPLNPYVKLTMKKQGASADDEPIVEERRTRVIGGGNTAPKWNQEVVFDIDCYQKTLSLACYDEDLLDDDETIGTVEVDLTEALNHQGETIEKTVILQDENVANRGEIRLGLRFEGVRETDAQADKEGEEWRKATKVKLGTDFEACTKVMLGNNRAQLLKMCERYVKAFGVTPHDDLRGESFLKPATKLWARAILELILPNEEEGGGLNSRWGAGPMRK